MTSYSARQSPSRSTSAARCCPPAARLLVHLRIPRPSCPACCLCTRCSFALPAPCVVADYPAPGPSTPPTVTPLPAALIASHSIPALRARSPSLRTRLLSSAHATRCRILAARTLHSIPALHDRSARARSFLTSALPVLYDGSFVQKLISAHARDFARATSISLNLRARASTLNVIT
jgi:hypothetical protein